MAILKRRIPRRMAKTIREALWPSMGWWRTMQYYRHRVFRTGDSTYRVTSGLATGMSISFSPFIGTHVIQAFFITWLLRGSYVASFIGTAFGNPSTYPLFLWMSYKVGALLCSPFGLGELIAMPDDLAWSQLILRPLQFMTYLFDHPVKLLLPLSIGGYTIGLLGWPIFYLALYYPVRTAQTAYKAQREKRMKKKQAKQQAKQA